MSTRGTDTTQRKTPSTTTARANKRAAAMPETPSPSTQKGGPIYFWRETEEPYGWMSQWYEYAMRDGADSTIVYPTAEHYMMYQKAKLFGDEKIAREVLAGTELHPRKIKNLGRKVKGFDETTWVAERERIVEEGTWLKMTRPAHDEQVNLAELLLATGDRELVEASPYDQVWGVGFRAKDAEKSRERWGMNLLGKALMAVRGRLSKDSGEHKADGIGDGKIAAKEAAEK